jgi:hypothetical protein
MAFFTGLLQLDPTTKANIAKIADAADRMAKAAEAMVVKMNEDEDDPAVLQQKIDEYTARLNAGADRLEGKTSSSP